MPGVKSVFALFAHGEVQSPGGRSQTPGKDGELEMLKTHVKNQTGLGVGAENSLKPEEMVGVTGQDRVRNWAVTKG